jgi:hypothetical protein
MGATLQALLSWLKVDFLSNPVRNISSHKIGAWGDIKCSPPLRPAAVRVTLLPQMTEFVFRGEGHHGLFG